LLVQYLRAGRRAYVTVSDRTPGSVVPAGVANPLVVSELVRRRRLLIRHEAAVDPTTLIADIVAAFPNDRVAVLCATRRRAGDLAAGLRRLDVKARAFFDSSGRDRGPAPRVVVGTRSALASPDAAAEECRIVIVIDPVHFAGPAGIGLRLEPAWKYACWLALLPADRSVSPLERDRLRCFFGFGELHIPAPGQVRRRVLFANELITATGPIDTTSAQTVAMTGVIRNGPRNRLTVALARDLADRTTPPSRRFGVVADATDIAGAVVILARDREHAARLRPLQRAADRDRVRVVTPDEAAGGCEPPNGWWTARRRCIFP
jgi:hypothetical protein